MEKELASCSALIKSHFRLAEEEFANSISFDLLEQRLTSIINYMLDQDFNQLLNAFYKIDISEQKFKEILSSSAPSEVANTLAKEVIKRELQKVATRLKYKNS